ncbi:DoxX family membrane protein [Glycomyces artemisiae]|uniref:Thiosulfate dehydrogenase [quinone] large subunit n=1 Tax=Glycomyces artemisiae TaxID=1076443 RepID=A0A2T0UQ05_9ACTN|nr:DoxX family membrane protein [Glycomyces artemisiae]PRY59986.1 thiosulfate dehydrogenase [quinone] large subunit [Glycomyces artemisiae]
MTTSPATESTITPAAAAHHRVDYVWAVLRIALGWVFLWAFLDKTFGLGFATERDASWLNGGSPTEGFLSFGTKGPLADFYQGMAGSAFADWLFMAGLLGIGLALVLGIGMRIAAAAGALLLVLMWSAALWPENNPFMDDHLVYAGLLIGLAMTHAGDTLGLGKAWAATGIVARNPWLK